MTNQYQTAWEQYCETELSIVLPMLTELGYAIDPVQPHLGGERYFMQAVTTRSGRKLILLGTRIKDGLRVVIKATSDTGGKHEIRHERLCREVLGTIKFAYEVFFTPKEILFLEQSAHVIAIQEFIEQERTFISRPTSEQFAFALRAFKAQESMHASTYEHERLIHSTLGIIHTNDYLSSFANFSEYVRVHSEGTSEPNSLFSLAAEFLNIHKEHIEQYTGFLTHTDFVPHNFRIRDNQIYLLDYSSLRFGNKYEGWARFANFMALYNPELEAALLQYVRDNRAPEEFESLQAMRVYRLGEIIRYYVGAQSRSEGDLYTLNALRVDLWSGGLTNLLDQSDSLFTPDTITRYQSARDSLRSESEHVRQRDLH